MATPNEKLADALDALWQLQAGGRRVFQSEEISRLHRERLLKHGFALSVMNGWLISSSAETRTGDSTPWYAAFWEFCARYCKQRFKDEWYLSADLSLLLCRKLRHPIAGHRLFKQRDEQSAAAAVRNVDIRSKAIEDTDRRRYDGNGRVAGAFRHIGRADIAHEVAATMKAAGYDVREANPFTMPPIVSSNRAANAPIVLRIEGAWHSMREAIIDAFSRAPGLPRNSAAYLRVVDDIYKSEEYASVRAVLGHWLFGYVHPYPDGNGRMARFVMNAMLASGGYPWTIIRVEDRARYLEALDTASIDGDIVPFTRLIVERLESRNE